ncbi:MAG: ABC transporter permease [Anaerolineae bacterium]|nr:ABC transporter permease [Anaerolineae bacterium]
MAIWTIARLTWQELGRRRVVLAGLILTALVLGLTAWGFHSLPNVQCGNRPCPPEEIRTAASALTILLMYMFSFVVALAGAFLAAPAIANDIESGIALAVLPRPIRRSDVLLGKWLALGSAIALYTAVVATAIFAIVKYFTGYQPPAPVTAIAFITGEGLALLTLALLGSTRIGPLACGITAVVLFGLAWIAGVIGGIGLSIGNQAVTNVGVIASLILPTDGLWRGAMFHLEPAVMIAAVSQSPRGVNANVPFFAYAPPPTAYIVYAVGWILAMLALAAYNFDRREL